MKKLLFLTSLIFFVSCNEPLTVPVIVAHRGASYDAPENTIPAFILAWEQGADAIEGDFFLTADGEIVCIHDPGTGRVAGTDLEVKNSTVEELRKLDVGSWKGEEWKGTQIPLISEVFKLVPSDRKIFVEVKSGTEILPKLYREIDDSGLRADQIILISFDSEVIREFRIARPEHKAYWLSGFTRDDQGNVLPGLEEVLETLEMTGANGFSSHHGLISKEFIEKIFESGYEYHVWTVNEPARALELAKYGALSITTDVPGLIREYIDNYQMELKTHQDGR